MIIWSGLGFLVAVIVFGFSLVLNLAFNAWFGEGYYNAHKWPVALSLLLSAVACWFLGLVLRDRDQGGHTLFFIPMHLWGPILAVIGVVVLVADVLK